MTMTYDDITCLCLLFRLRLFLSAYQKENLTWTKIVLKFSPSLPHYTRFSHSWYQEARMSIQNLQTFDPFSDASKGFNESSLQDGPIHIRIQQRNGRKTLTTVQGIHDKYDKKKLVKAFKKEFACNGTVVENEEYGEVIQLQGDQRKNISDFLLNIELAKKEQLHVHGF